MKAFLLKTCVAALCALLVNAGVALYRMVKLDEYSGKKTMALDWNPSALTLGDSHMKPLGDLRRFDCENLAFESDNYIDMERKLARALGRHKIRRVVISVDNHALSPYRAGANNNLVTPMLTSSFEHVVFLFLPAFNDYVVKLMKSDLKQAILSLLGKNTNKQAGAPPKKWSELSVGERKKLAESRFRLQYGFDQPAKELVEALKRISQTCRTRSVELVGVKFPIAPVYRPFVANRNYGADSLLRNDGWKVVDYTRLYDDPERFKDQDHLTEEAGRRLAAQLAQDALSPKP